MAKASRIVLFFFAEHLKLACEAKGKGILVGIIFIVKIDFFKLRFSGFQALQWKKTIENTATSGSYALITALSQFLTHQRTHLTYKGKENVCDRV